MCQFRGALVNHEINFTGLLPSENAHWYNLDVVLEKSLFWNSQLILRKAKTSPISGLVGIMHWDIESIHCNAESKTAHWYYRYWQLAVFYCFIHTCDGHHDGQLIKFAQASVFSKIFHSFAMGPQQNWCNAHAVISRKNQQGCLFALIILKSVKVFNMCIPMPLIPVMQTILGWIACYWSDRWMCKTSKTFSFL